MRNRGTIGGSLAHADPASDMPAVMLALHADFQLRSKRGGRRTVAARNFFKGPFSTDMAEGELFTDSLIPGMGRKAGACVSFDQAKDTRGDPAVIARAAADAVAGVEIAGDLHAPAECRRHIAQVAARRAVFPAHERAGGRTG